MPPKSRAKRRPATHPDDFPLGSPESRAAARTLAEKQERATPATADRMIRIISHIPGLPRREAVYTQPDGTTVAVIIEPAAPLESSTGEVEQATDSDSAQNHRQFRRKGDKK